MIYKIIEYYLEKETEQFTVQKVFLLYSSKNLGTNTSQFLKDETELSQFKTKIKTSTTSQCPCRLCKKYIGHVGFI